MTQSRADGAADWSRVNDVFHRALVEPREARTAFLDQACAGDSALREEVASLLAAHEESPDFIQRPAAGASTLIEAAMESMSVAAGPLLAPGDLVGQYRIVHMLGRGGMGIVYLAEDTRLGRAVALKAVAPRFANDERRRERLRREARAAASLSHPGIATVYALETFGDELFVASEFVAGQTLRQELARGPLPPSRAIATALQLSRALACAHERGVVHRDLKPENVIRAENGDVKILDFGLARLGDPMGADGVLTEDGAVLGTPAYMSPEQARGQAVDFRSDIFSLGTLIYELATGINPFAGGSTASTVVKILEVDPPGLLSIRHQSAASELGWLEPIVHACLQKPVASRYRSTRDLVRALEDAHQAITSGRPVPTLVVSAALSGGTGAERWWRFHQAAATSAYAALLAPMWLAHMWTPGAGPLLLFIVALAAVIVAGTLRLHLWFAVSSYPAEWPAQHAVSRRLIRIADMTFVAALFAAAALLLTTHEEVAIVLIAAGVAIVLSALIIEPATTRAAFGEHTPRAS